MFTNIAIVSPQGNELQDIRAQLRNPMRFTLREFVSLEQVRRDLAGFSFEIMIMRFPVIDVRFVKAVQILRERFPKSGFIGLAPQIDPGTRYQTRNFPRCVLLHEPSEQNDLLRLVEKLSKGDVHPARLHPRMVRHDRVELFDPESGVKVKAKFIDFAQMGARILAHPQNLFMKNHSLELRYSSTSDPGRVNRIESRVVWAEVASGMMDTIVRGPQQLLGLRFIAAL